MPELKTDNWVRAGWQGLSFTIPEDWNIGAIGGEKNEGYLRFDDPDMPRLEIKWAEAGSSAISIETLVDKYLKDLTKGKKKNTTTVERDCKLVSKRKLKGKKGLECFSWTAESQGFGAAWYCPDCHRTMIVQVMGTLEEPVQKFAEEIIPSIEDHPGEWMYWGTYGFQAETPADWKLAGQKLMAGLISLDLIREGEKLHVARWGMANVALRGTTLEQWGQKELSKRLKKYTTQYATGEFRGHEDILIEGRSNLPQEKVQSFFEHVRGKDFADRVRAHLWHCPESNKIYYVEGIMDREHLDEVEAVRDRMPCD
jgi:hypothetical protein